MNKITVFLRLYFPGEDYPCAAAIVKCQVSGEGAVSYNVADLDTLRSALFAGNLPSVHLFWAQVHEQVLLVAQTPTYTYGTPTSKIALTGGYMITREVAL